MYEYLRREKEMAANRQSHSNLQLYLDILLAAEPQQVFHLS